MAKVIARSAGKKPRPPRGFPDKSAELAALTARQGVKPVSDFEELLGDFWPEDESADDFIAATRAWRREGSRRRSL